MTNRVFTGLKPTGQLQVGNYLGAIRPLLEMGSDPHNELLVCVADLHALTVEHDPARLSAHTFEMATTLLACGVGEVATLFVQSSVPAHTELSYFLESVATYGEMHRMVQFKEKATSQESARLSLLTYPALMAADILAYQIHTVPVGEDQRQHLELTRTLARRFNSKYGDTFLVPDGFTPKETARIKDLKEPSQKMGKTGSNGAGTLFLRDPKDVLVNKVKKAVTDNDPSLSYDPEGRPGVANLANLLGAFSGVSPQESLEGLRGSGDLKAALIEAALGVLLPIQERYEALSEDPAHLRSLLAAGRDTVAPLAEETLRSARSALGLVTLG